MDKGMGRPWLARCLPERESMVRCAAGASRFGCGKGDAGAVWSVADGKRAEEATSEDEKVVYGMTIYALVYPRKEQRKKARKKGRKRSQQNTRQGQQ